jgi:hypothetical protein
MATWLAPSCHKVVRDLVTQVDKIGINLSQGMVPQQGWRWQHHQISFGSSSMLSHIGHHLILCFVQFFMVVLDLFPIPSINQGCDAFFASSLLLLVLGCFIVFHLSFTCSYNSTFSFVWLTWWLSWLLLSEGALWFMALWVSISRWFWWVTQWTCGCTEWVCEFTKWAIWSKLNPWVGLEYLGP